MRHSIARPAYGWAIVTAVFVMLTVSSGMGFYSLTVYLRALTVEHGFTVSAVSGATGVFFLANGFAGIPIAAAISRADPRWTIAGGAVVAGIALALLAWVSALWHVYAIYLVFGVAAAASSLVPGTTMVTQWFARRRAIALAVASTGLSFGGIAITPTFARLIVRHGLSDMAPWLGATFVLGIVPVTLLLLRPAPAAVKSPGQGRVEGGHRTDAAPSATGTTFRVAVHTRFFRLLTAAYALVQMAQIGALSHHFNLVSERLDEVFAATAVSLLAGAALAGRLAGGWLVTALPMRAFTGALIVLQVAALLLLAGAGSALALVTGSVVFGLALGNLMMMTPLLLAHVFGVRDYARIFSVNQMFVRLGVAAGPYLIGIVYDLVSGYGAAFSVIAVLSAAGFGLLLLAGPARPYEPAVLQTEPRVEGGTCGSKSP